MKKAKVSSVYEGRRKKGGSIEEKENSSRTARMNARGRKNSFRARTLNYLAASNKQWMINNYKQNNNNNNVTTTNNTTQKQKEVVVINIPDDDDDDDDVVVVEEEAIHVQVPENKNVVEVPDSGKKGEEGEKADMMEMNVKMEKWGDEGEWWEEWPLCWSYEEQQMWGCTNNGINPIIPNDDHDFMVGDIWN